MAYSIEQIKGVIGAEGGLAKSNLFAVQLPPLPGTFFNTSSLNLLTKSVTLPSRQISTLERSIGGYRSKVANGSLTDDISMTFRVTNSMEVKEYFEAWMQLIWNTDTRRAGYFRDYAKRVQIKVLKQPKFDASIDIGTGGLPLTGLAPDINFGPINANLAAGTLSFDFGQDTIQTITLENAYPFTMNPIEMSDENEGFMELNISFTYSEWFTDNDSLGNVLSGIGINI